MGTCLKNSSFPRGTGFTKLWLLFHFSRRKQGCQMVYVFIPKIPKWEWKIMVYVYSHLALLWSFGRHILWYFVAIGYILWSFGIFLHIRVCCTKKNLATRVGRLHWSSPRRSHDPCDIFVYFPTIRNASVKSSTTLLLLLLTTNLKIFYVRQRSMR
jgi:hypothetical protein